MEEAKTKEEAKEDRRNRKRSPIQNKRKHKNNKRDGTNMDAQTTIAKKTGDTEDTTTLDHTSMERGTSQKMSPKKNGKLLNARTTKRKDEMTG